MANLYHRQAPEATHKDSTTNRPSTTYATSSVWRCETTMLTALIVPYPELSCLQALAHCIFPIIPDNVKHTHLNLPQVGQAGKPCMTTHPLLLGL